VTALPNLARWALRSTWRKIAPHIIAPVFSRRILSGVDRRGETAPSKNATGMRRLTATFHVSTPLFLGNAAQQPELLAAPFKRALRFWWRALNYHLVEPDEKKPFAKLLAREAKLFGAAAAEYGARSEGRCPFNLRIGFGSILPRSIIAGEVLREASNDPGLIYLGYGLMDMGRRATRDRPEIKRGTLQRGCIWSPGGFEVSLELALPRVGQPSEEIIDAIKLFGLIGGGGGRSRRGFGSISLTNIESDAGEIWTAPTSTEAYSRCIREILKRYKTNLKSQDLEFTAFATDSRIEVVDEGKDQDGCRLLGSLGHRMQLYRSWGIRRDGQRVVGHLPREKRFRSDHNWYLYWKMFAEPDAESQFHTGDIRDTRDRPDGRHPPQRAVFGLPQNYKQYLGVVGPHSENYEIDRRSSPLFVHIHRLGVSNYVTVLLLLPARFLPVNRVDIAFRDPIGITYTENKYTKRTGHPDTRQGWSERFSQPFTAEFSVIGSFFDAVMMTGSDRNKRYFPDPVRIWP
jgi:CRISPR-associated protein Cmr1